VNTYTSPERGKRNKETSLDLVEYASLHPATAHFFTQPVPILFVNSDTLFKFEDRKIQSSTPQQRKELLKAASPSGRVATEGPDVTKFR
jgi:hypothetical protein